MNYIHQLQNENARLKNDLSAARDRLIELECYLLSTKFQGVDNDYVHVSTDILPKITNVRSEITI